MLQDLIDYRGEVFSRERLLRIVWPLQSLIIFHYPRGRCAHRRLPLSAAILFIGRAPCRIFVKRRHGSRDRRSIRPNVFLVDNPVIRDDEGHHSR